jgi:6-phosphogluconolactonase/glucosamine-6-phosphate isomerase/deaminase
MDDDKKEFLQKQAVTQRTGFCVQGGSTPGSITQDMVNCDEISWENPHLKDQETEE